VLAAELQPWVLFEFSGAVIRGAPASGCAGPTGGVNSKPAGIFHPARFDEHLTGNFVDKGKHLAAAVWAKATIDMGAIETHRCIGLILSLYLHGVHREQNHGRFTGARGRFAS